MRYLLWAVAIVSVAVLAYLAWVQYDRAVRAEEEVGRLQEERDLAEARADSAEAEAKRHEEEAAALEQELLREQGRIEAKADDLARRADSLASAIGELIPPGTLHDSVTAIVAHLRASYEERLDDLHGLLGVSMARSAALEQQTISQEKVIGHLREALQATEEQRDAYLRALSPGIWERLKQNVELLVIGATAGGGIVAVVLTVL